MNQFLILIGILVGLGIIVSVLESKNKYIKRTGEIVFGTIATVILSGMVTLLVMGALILTLGAFVWILAFVFDLLNLPPGFEDGVFSLLRPAFFWANDDYIKPTLFVLWVIILFVGFKGDWVKKKLAWVLYRKRATPEPEKSQQELPKMKKEETVLDYFHRIQSIKNKDSKDREKKPRKEPSSSPKRLLIPLSNSAEEALAAVKAHLLDNHKTKGNEEEFEVQVRLPRETYEPQEKQQQSSSNLLSESSDEEIELVEGDSKIKAFQLGSPFQKTKEEKELPTKNNNQPSQNNEKN
ncbi:MAG: hypothetical protein WC908_00595 [Candidatus Paceibacterota bacterium]